MTCSVISYAIIYLIRFVILSRDWFCDFLTRFIMSFVWRIVLQFRSTILYVIVLWFRYAIFYVSVFVISLLDLWRNSFCDLFCNFIPWFFTWLILSYAISYMNCSAISLRGYLRNLFSDVATRLLTQFVYLWFRYAIRSVISVRDSLHHSFDGFFYNFIPRFFAWFILWSRFAISCVIFFVFWLLDFYGSCPVISLHDSLRRSFGDLFCDFIPRFSSWFVRRFVLRFGYVIFNVMYSAILLRDYLRDLLCDFVTWFLVGIILL